jgi:hypothetical protein
MTAKGQSKARPTYYALWVRDVVGVDDITIARCVYFWVLLNEAWPKISAIVKMSALKPQTVAQIEFTEWTPDGHLRHSRFVGLREDKAASEVVREG